MVQKKNELELLNVLDHGTRRRHWGEMMHQVTVYTLVN